MKKINKLFVILVGVIGLTFITNVYAENTLSFGKNTSKDNTVEIPISISVSDDNLSAVQFGCSTNNDDVECKLVPENNILETKGTSYNTYSYNSNDATIFPKESLVIAKLVLTNSKNYSINSNNLSVSLENISFNINGSLNKYTGTAPSKNVSIGAKAEEKKPISDPTLKDVSVSQGTIYPVFDKDVTEYTVYGIADTINSIKFTLTCNEGECNPVVTGGKGVSNKTVTLAQGENKVSITVTSQDYTKNLTYEFTVIRGDTAFNSDKLGKLIFGNYVLSPEFKSDVFEYNLNIPYEINNLTNVIDYAAEDKNATVELKGIDSFKYGLNTLEIIVTNASKDMIKTYKVNIYRMESEEVIVSKYLNDEVTFTCGDTTKTVKLDEFKVLASSEYAKIVNEEYQFDEEGNLTTTIENKTTTKKVEETTDKKDNNTLVIIIIIGSGVLIIGVSAFLIFKKPAGAKKNKEEKEEETKVEEVKEEVEKTEVNIGDDFTQDLTVSIEDALNDLMNTKQYSFTDSEVQNNEKLEENTEEEIEEEKDED